MMTFVIPSRVVTRVSRLEEPWCIYLMSITLGNGLAMVF